MKSLYKLPGFLLVCFGGFCLSWGGYIIRSFEQASIWQILFIRSFFFLLALLLFLFIIYRKNTFKIIKSSGFPGALGGFVMSFSFVAFVVSMSSTNVANVVFIISTQTMFLAIFGYFYLKEKIFTQAAHFTEKKIANKRVLLRADNSSTFIINYLACHLIGSTCVPFDPDIKSSQLKEIKL